MALPEEWPVVHRMWMLQAPDGTLTTIAGYEPGSLQQFSYGYKPVQVEVMVIDDDA